MVLKFYVKSFKEPLCKEVKDVCVMQSADRLTHTVSDEKTWLYKANHHVGFEGPASSQISTINVTGVVQP